MGAGGLSAMDPGFCIIYPSDQPAVNLSSLKVGSWDTTLLNQREDLEPLQGTGLGRTDPLSDASSNDLCATGLAHEEGVPVST